MAKAYCNFPRAGLGNLMLVWARTVVFAHENNISHIVDPWWGFRMGPLLRREKKKRLYFGYFKETSVFRLAMFKLYARLAKKVQDPDLVKLTDEQRNSATVYEFHSIGPDRDLYGYLVNHVDFVKQQLFALLNPKIKLQYEKVAAPCISLHIRRGDFKNNSRGEAKLTALEYFIDTVNLARKVTGKMLPVTVFTDAYPEEIKELLDMPEVSLAPERSDILDILVMSKSKMMVLSRNSTFGYWGAFLSDALIIRQYDHQARIKNPSGAYREVIWNNDDPAKDEQVIKAIQNHKFD